MKYSKNILDTIGNTPLIKLNFIVKNIKSMVLAKVESFNPGNSVKDRMAVKMIKDAEDEGKLKKGDTIIEGTSGWEDYFGRGIPKEKKPHYFKMVG